MGRYAAGILSTDKSNTMDLSLNEVLNRLGIKTYQKDRIEWGKAIANSYRDRFDAQPRTQEREEWTGKEMEIMTVKVYSRSEWKELLPVLMKGVVKKGAPVGLISPRLYQKYRTNKAFLIRTYASEARKKLFKRKRITR